VGAKFDQSILLLTAAADTTDQTSIEFRRPGGASSLILLFDVTVGSTLLLDLNPQYYNEGLAAWANVIEDIPGAGGITGVSENHVVIGLHGPTGDSSLIPSMNYVFAPLFERNRIVVDHGNVNAATYTLHAQWR